jgi:hypothetical protein
MKLNQIKSSLWKLLAVVLEKVLDGKTHRKELKAIPCSENDWLWHYTY